MFKGDTHIYTHIYIYREAPNLFQTNVEEVGESTCPIGESTGPQWENKISTESGKVWFQRLAVSESVFSR